MRRWPLEASSPGLAFMPFLDIVFAVIGILVVVFALRDSQPRATGRPLAIDYLILCQEDARVQLYLSPEQAPEHYGPQQFPALFERLTQADPGLRSLVFAHTGRCFSTRHRFEQAFARHNSLLRQDRTASAVALRLNFYPLSMTGSTSAAALLERWRGTAPGTEHGTQ